MKIFSEGSSPAAIRVSLFGVGGAGNNVLHVLDASDQVGCAVCSVNSDARLLAAAKAPCKIKLGEGVTYGLGAGGDPALGAKMARESESSFVRAFEGCDLAVFVSGLGGGTGSGALPVMAKLAREMGVFLVSVVAMPFEFEGARRREQAEAALESISLYSDIVMVFENDWMGTLLKESGLAHDAFAAANKLMARAVAFVPRLVRSHGLLHLGLDDLKSALSGRGHRCLFGCAEGEGSEDADALCLSVFDSPLLKQGEGIPSGSDVLVHVSGGSDLTFARVQEILNTLTSRLPSGVRAHIGVSVADSPSDAVELVLFASMNEEPRVTAVKPSLPLVEEKQKESIKPVNVPPVQIIMAPVDPIDEVPLFQEEPIHDEVANAPDQVNVEADAGIAEAFAQEGDDDEVTRPEMGEDHLILQSGELDDEEPEEAPVVEKKEKPVTKKAGSRSLPDSLASGKGRFDGDNPFIVDGEDLDLPPSMRKKH